MCSHEAENRSWQCDWSAKKIAAKMWISSYFFKVRANKFTLWKMGFKDNTDRTRFDNATRFFSFQKQIKASTDKNFTRYADQIAKIASVVATISKTLKNIKVKCH